MSENSGVKRCHAPPIHPAVTVSHSCSRVWLCHVIPKSFMLLDSTVLGFFHEMFSSTVLHSVLSPYDMSRFLRMHLCKGWCQTFETNLDAHLHTCLTFLRYHNVLRLTMWCAYILQRRLALLLFDDMTRKREYIFGVRCVVLTLPQEVSPDGLLGIQISPGEAQHEFMRAMVAWLYPHS